MRIVYSNERTADPATGCRWIAEYDSVLDVAAVVDSPNPSWAPDPTSAKSHEPSDNWDLNCGYDQAREYLVSGWRDGAERIHAQYTPVYDRITSRMIRETLSYDVTGDILDVERYACGEPECFGVWQQEVVENPGHRVLTLDYNVAASNGVAAETLAAKGAAVCALIEALEYAGYRVEVRAVDCQQVSIIRKRTEHRYHTVDRTYVKRADEPLNLARLAFTLAHPAYMRRIWFAVQDHWPKWAYTAAGGGRGWPSETDGVRAAADMYFDGAMLDTVQARNPESAVKWVEDELKKQGVKFHE